METITLQRTVLFGSDALRGNEAIVVSLAQAPTPQHLQRFCAMNVTTCFAWQEQDAVAAQCYHGNSMIQLCGHGLLAVANVWLSRTGIPASLRSRTELYTTRLDNGSLWLCVPRLHCTETELPADCRDWFDYNGQPGPHKSAIAGGAQGYRVLEWPENTELAGLRPRFDRMIGSESRSIIVTQAFARNAQKTWDFSLRYFAPQYGVPEDNATGSANAVLADYWSGRDLCGRKGADATFRALQCSKGGGAVMSRVCGSFVEIGGQFHVIETTTARYEPDNVSASLRA